MVADVKPIKVDVWTDFVSPDCFLATFRLEDLRKAHGLDVRWHAYMLRPPGAPEPPDSARRLLAAERKHVAEVVKLELDMDLDPGPIGIRTRDAHIAMAYANRNGAADNLQLALMRAYWLEAQPINERAIISRIAASVGLSPNGLAAAWDSTEYVKAVNDDMSMAVGYGIRSVPAQMFGDIYKVSGAQPYELLEEVIKKLSPQA
jgi:predicted DsbA family dithiol-disulfide isomerase